MVAPALADRVVEAEASSGFDLFIYSMYEKPGWQPRAPGDRIRVAHPGTAVSYGEKLYEVMAIEPAAGTSYAYRYALRRWDDSFVVRKVVPYSREAAVAGAVEVRERVRRHRQHSWLIYLFPLTGLLPTPLLRRWQREWGLPMRAASFASVVAIGLPAVFLFWREFLRPDRAGSPAVVAVAGFILLEQLARLFWLLPSNEAIGSLTLTALWGLLVLATGGRLETDGVWRAVYHLAAERDEVRYLKEQPWDVEVRSVFRDPVLLGPRPVRVEDGVYQPLEYTQEGEGLYRRYVFRLRELDEKTPPHREYRRDRTPEQVRELMAYERARNSVHAWALLYGLLPAARQLDLERRYDLLCAQATARSAATVLAAAALALVAALLRGFRLADAGVVYLAVESIYRLAVARSRGEPAGSVLGFLLSPLLRK